MASKIQASDAKNNDLNLTPLIDAVFLLLVVEKRCFVVLASLGQLERAVFCGIFERFSQNQWFSHRFGPQYLPGRLNWVGDIDFGVVIAQNHYTNALKSILIFLLSLFLKLLLSYVFIFFLLYSLHSSPSFTDNHSNSLGDSISSSPYILLLLILIYL